MLIATLTIAVVAAIVGAMGWLETRAGRVQPVAAPPIAAPAPQPIIIQLPAPAPAR